jgi:hypothetical protein
MSYPPPLRQTSGFQTQVKGSLFGSFPHPLRTFDAYHEYFNDFDTYAAADWTITTSSGTNALSATNGGAIVLTTAASDSDVQAMWLSHSTFALTPGYDAWFGIRFQYSNALQALGFGLCPSASAGAPTSGVYFTKAASGTSLTLNVEIASTNTTLAIPGTIAAATWYTVGFRYTGSASTPSIQVFTTVENTTPNAGASVFKPVGGFAVIAQATLTNIPTAVLSPGMWIKNKSTDATARTLTVDGIGCSASFQRN